MAKKVFLQDENKVELLPITRGELILDSSGRMALHSDEFLASTSQPGLMSSADKKKIDNVKTDDSLSTTSVNPVQNKVVTVAINKAQADATDAKTTANANKEELTKTQQILNVIKTSYLKSASVSGNTLTIKDQNDSEVKFYNTTYGIVSSSTNGLAPAIGTSVSSIIGNQADEWVLTSTKGGTPTWRKLPVNAFLNNNDNTTYTLSGGLSGNTFVSTLKPSSGTNTTSTVPAMTAASASAAGKAGLVPAPPAGAQGKVLSGAGTWISIPTLSITDSETGNAVTDVTVSGHGITLKRGSVFSLQGHIHATSDITSLTGYSKASSIAALATSDTLNAALGKLECKADLAWDWISNVTAADTDEYINKWGEIVDFVDSVKEGTDILDEFVTRKTAQTITGAKSFGAPLYLGSYGVLGFGSPIDDAYTDGIDLEPEYNAVWLATTGEGYESAGILLDGSTIKLWSPMDNPPVFVDSDSGVNYGILHSGNSSVSKSGETLTVEINGTEYSLTNTKYTTLPNPYSISFKNASNTTVSYNGSSALNLTGGIYYATNSSQATSLFTASGLSGDTHSAALKTYFDNNKATVVRNKLLSFYSGARSNGSQYMGYFLSGYDSTPYGGFFVAHYNTPWYVGISNGSFTEQRLLTSTNYTDYVNTTNFPGLHKVGTVTKVSTGEGLTGGDITTSGTISLSPSGVSAGSYGPSAAVTGSHNSSISIPYITVDTYGRVTNASNKTYTSKNYYPTAFSWTGGTTAGPTGSLTGTGMNAVSFAAIPSASGSASGIVTTGAQTLAGSKTFTNLVVAKSGVQIGSTSDIGWYFNSGGNRITAGVINARGVNVGSLLISNAWADYTEVPTNGAYIKGNILTPSLIQVVNTDGNKDLGMRVQGSSNDIGFIIDSENVNRGIYDYTNSEWMLYCDSSKVRITTWSSIGSATNPVYFSATGDPLKCTYNLSASVNSGTSGKIAYYSSATSIDDYTSNKGTSTKGIYLSAGVPTEMSYSLNATINSGTANYLAYYSGTNTISSRSISSSTSTLYILGVTSGSSLPYSATQSTSGVRIVSGNTVYAYNGFYEASDERLKNFYEDVEVDLEKLSQLPKKYFQWKKDNSGFHIGTSAQELQKLYPELVGKDNDGFLHVSYDKLSVIALKAIDTLYQEHKQLKKRVDELEKLLTNRGIL